jgi:hypothetical protein
MTQGPPGKTMEVLFLFKAENSISQPHLLEPFSSEILIRATCLVSGESLDGMET